jgi:peptidyl-prolyl cis-trans isomerase B (cyclophilin B)
VNLRRRLRATTTVAILGFCMATTLFVPTSFASSHSSPRSSSASSPSGSGCSKTNAVAHNPIKVGYPDAKSSMVNRTFTLNTNCGQIVFKTWGKKAPATVIAMAFLAKSGYFDHSLCHRITTAGIYVLQCGDPTASGSGGPMWQYKDENLPEEGSDSYPAGTIAMANSGANTNGSQFFIVYKDTNLPPDYSIWGEVTKGLDIVKRIAAAGVVGGGTDGTPKLTIAIDSVSVK